MERELIIQTYKEGTDIALLENKVLVEYHKESKKNVFNIGDIYLGKVRKASPGMNAVFVDIGHEKDGFLHYTDIGPYVQSYISYAKQAIQGTADVSLKKFEIIKESNKDGKIEEELKNKTFIPVQILKEPISSKGARLSCELSLAGRYIVMTPFVDTIGVSKKISTSSERDRLKGIVESLKPKGMGFIVRTVAEGVGVKEIQDDIIQLQSKWNSLTQRMKNADIPRKILNEEDKTSKMLRDLLNDSFTRVITNNENLTNEIKEYITKISPDKADIVELHKDSQALFDKYGITKQVKSLFGKTVNMSNGGYLIIEHTEAMHVIDINSGNSIERNQTKSQEETAIANNLVAAEEIARQLRLRDMGGIIAIDFVDMKEGENREKVYQTMQEAMKMDKAEYTILPLSKFCIMQITRSRVKPEMKITTTEVCPSCQGTGKVMSTLVLSDDIERQMRLVLTANSEIKVIVHPYIEAYIKKGFWSILWQWRWKYKSNIKVISDQSLPITEYKFFDGEDEIINL
jgi:ribonuclease G